MILNCLIVGTGGFIGAVCRYLLGLIPINSDFPVMTFIINVSGGLIFGFLAGIFHSFTNMPQKWALFSQVGLCGGFTALSGLSYETICLFENNKPVLGITYALLSVLMCIAGVFIGRFISQLIFKRI